MTFSATLLPQVLTFWHFDLLSQKVLKLIHKTFSLTALKFILEVD